MVQESEVIRCQIDAARMALSEKLQELERRIMDTVVPAANGQEAAAESHHSVEDSVEETMAHVKEALDLPHQVEKHPWAILAGATALGVLGGFLIRRGTAQTAGSVQTKSQAETNATCEGRNGSGPAKPETANRLHEEIANLKSLATGTLLGVARDLVVDALSRPLEEQIANVLDAIATRLGGHPPHGRILPPRQVAGCRSMADE
jgi:hypothetical protein